MKLPTASELPRVAACPPSAALPQHRLPATQQSDTGTAVHLFMSQGVVSDNEEVNAIGYQLLAAMPPGAWRWEVSLSMDTLSGEARELGEHLERDYTTATPTELVGTADAISVEAGLVRILEVKTGWRPVSADGWQTRLLALAAARAHRRDLAIVVLLTGHADGARAETVAYDSFELDAIEQELANLLGRIETEKQPTPGDWCRYCPCVASCNAATGLVRALASVDGDAEDLTPESVAGVYRTLQAARAALTRLEGQLETYALQSPVPLGNGRFWGLRQSEAWKFDNGAPAALRQILGPVADKAIGLNLSTTSLARAVGRDEARRVTALLEQQGLATRKQTARLAEYSERGEG